MQKNFVMRLGWLQVICWVLSATSLMAQAEPMARGDAAWARRADGAVGGRAQAAPIAEAVAAFEAALQARPGDALATWKLLRALHFQGDYTGLGREERRRIFDRGRTVAELAIDELARRTVGRGKLDDLDPEEVGKLLAAVPESAPVFFWAGVHWGLWGEAFGATARS
jgi:hypothetical protein